jgi:hypothetical protein
MTNPRTRALAASLALAVLVVPAGAQSPAPPSRPAAPASAVAPVAAPAASPADAPAAAAARQAAGTAPRVAPATPRVRAMDRVELEASRITGNRELPRVMYVVPWRQPGAGEVDGRPVNSLLYELSAPVDREVARRELRYGEPAAAPAAGGPAP